MYNFTRRKQQLFGLLQDDLSREIFKARLLFDVEPSMSNAMRVLCLNEAVRRNPAELARRLEWKKTLEEVNGSGKKLILYGAGNAGSVVASYLQYENIEFYGFCDRRADSFKNGLMGKPVVPPEYLFQHSGECYALISSGNISAGSILRVLEENHFPQDHILPLLYAPSIEEQNKKQYFDFPSLYRRGTAFVTAGCYDCSTAYTFSEWCGGDYSRIFAFEPDPQSYAVCLERGKDLRGLKLIQAGLAERRGTAEFFVMGSGSGHLDTSGKEGLPDARKTTVQLTTVDEAAGSETVGMITLDVEGAELAALHGAEHTIRRDRPLLALSVYHLPGDTLAFMDYLHGIVPEYRFWLRHYSGPAASETVLYASVDPL